MLGHVAVRIITERKEEDTERPVLKLQKDLGRGWHREEGVKEQEGRDSRPFPLFSQRRS